MYDEITKLKLNIKYMERGIIPIGWSCNGVNPSHDFNRILADLPPALAREMKRKFRKEWKKIVKASLRHGGKKGRRLYSDTTPYERGADPTRRQRLARKGIVQAAITRELFKEEGRSTTLWG